MLPLIGGLCRAGFINLIGVAAGFRETDIRSI
jgi:hypothetical protein